MSRLPPTEKLPLAIRKDIRDNWEAKKADLEKVISDRLGTSWTVDINPSQIYAYAKDGYAKESTGSMITAYIEGVEWQLRSFVDKYGDDGKHELNTLAHAHIITMDIDTNKKVSYCGCEVSPTGQLVIIFNEDNLGCNIDHAANEENLTKALNDASSPSLTMSYVARKGIREDYDKEIGPIQKRLNEQLGKEITLKPEFESNFEKLKAAKDADPDWETNLGMYIFKYFDGLVWWMENNKVKDDDMVQEGLNEAASSGTVAFRIVDALKDGGYNESLIEGDVLYLQTVPKNFGVNIHQVADKLMDQL
ncbi:hypothetical protein QQS21_011363 [Conoideocrella luteorostrata]|uniref:Uncharacterized protein n=1 Tax=Conoideocrella luteorostrata TaxID=1105319 RepID=A0AAJ0CG05_9HYPO|nr:hypothetical protein QQS21_011363 [Conoideocrella luteorostrata]